MSSLTESDKRERLVGKKVEFRLLDEDNKEIYSASVEPRTKKVDLVGWIDRYKKSEERVSLGFLHVNHVGRIELFYYTNEPETLYLGHDNEHGRTFGQFSRHDAKRLFGLGAKAMQHLSVSGEYSKRKVDKRLKRYKEEIKRLKSQIGEQNDIHSHISDDISE